MEENNLFGLARELYDKHLLIYRTSDKKLASYCDSFEWEIVVNSEKKRKWIQTVIQFRNNEFREQYPWFRIYKGFAFLPTHDSFAAHVVLSMRGRRSQVYDVFCEYEGLEFLMQFKKASISWKDGRIVYEAKLPISDPELFMEVLWELSNLSIIIIKSLPR